PAFRPTRTVTPPATPASAAATAQPTRIAFPPSTGRRPYPLRLHPRFGAAFPNADVAPLACARRPSPPPAEVAAAVFAVLLRVPPSPRLHRISAFHDFEYTEGHTARYRMRRRVFNKIEQRLLAHNADDWKQGIDATGMPGHTT
ncbi:hypothetical protein U9M48_004322, partial [Paspalum notatum var. saurae]